MNSKQCHPMKIQQGDKRERNKATSANATTGSTFAPPTPSSHSTLNISRLHTASCFHTAPLSRWVAYYCSLGLFLREELSRSSFGGRFSTPSNRIFLLGPLPGRRLVCFLTIGTVFSSTTDGGSDNVLAEGSNSTEPVLVVVRFVFAFALRSRKLEVRALRAAESDEPGRVGDRARSESSMSLNTCGAGVCLLGVCLLGVAMGRLGLGAADPAWRPARRAPWDLVRGSWVGY